MVLYKLNPRTRQYDAYEVPDNWSVAAYAPTPDTFVDCAGCGKSLPYGAAFVSTEIYTYARIGYAVCKKCNGAEATRRADRERYQANRMKTRWDSDTLESIKRFDETVGAIRSALGLPQLGGSNDGKA